MDDSKETLGCQLFKQFIALQKGSVEQFFRKGAKQLNLRVGEFTTLIQIYLCEQEGYPATVSSLSEANHCTKSNISQITKMLEQKGYIGREPSDRDRRTLYLKVTQSTRDHMEANGCFGERTFIKAFDRFGEAKGKQLLDLMDEFAHIYNEVASEESAAN